MPQIIRKCQIRLQEIKSGLRNVLKKPCECHAKGVIGLILSENVAYRLLKHLRKKSSLNIYEKNPLMKLSRGTISMYLDILTYGRLVTCHIVIWLSYSDITNKSLVRFSGTVAWYSFWYKRTGTLYSRLGCSEIMKRPPLRPRLCNNMVMSPRQKFSLGRDRNICPVSPDFRLIRTCLYLLILKKLQIHVNFS